MDSAAFFAILRPVIAAALVGLVASGKLTSDQASQLTNNLIQIGTGLLALAPIAWSLIHSKQQHAAVITAAATGVPTQATIASPLVSPHA